MTVCSRYRCVEGKQPCRTEIEVTNHLFARSQCRVAGVRASCIISGRQIVKIDFHSCRDCDPTYVSRDNTNRLLTIREFGKILSSLLDIVGGSTRGNNFSNPNVGRIVHNDVECNGIILVIGIKEGSVHPCPHLKCACMRRDNIC